MNNRLTEIIFYFFCTTFTAKTNKLSQLHKLFEAINFTNSFDSSILIDVSTDMLVLKNNIPTLIECVLLAEQFPKVLTKSIIKKIYHTSDETIEKVIQYARINNISKKTVIPKYPKEVTNTIKEFNKILVKLTKILNNLNRYETGN